MKEAKKGASSAAKNKISRPGFIPALLTVPALPSSPRKPLGKAYTQMPTAGTSQSLPLFFHHEGTTAFFGVQKSVHLAPRHFLRLTFFVVKIMGKGEYIVTAHASK